jgi:2-keto-4-pentenoate hydratase
MVVTAALLVTASCGTVRQEYAAGRPADPRTTAAPVQEGATCQGFSLSLASDHGGLPSPVAAAEWFADGHDGSGVILRSGNVTLHAVQGPDTTWQVDSGRRC